jgi:hypothetical protein
LGWIPRPGASGSDNYWGTHVTIDAEGLRVGPRAHLTDEPCILAVGDSYTFGDAVSDDECWPYYLEELLGRPVINGGVFGYGMDQAVLRAESLLENRRVDVLILSIIPDDVRRCEYSYRYAAKPYFDVVNGGLVLRNVPVPPPTERPAGPLLTILGFSYLADAVLTRFAPAFWLDQSPGLVSSNRAGREIACLLIDRIKKAAEEHHARLLFVVQGHPPFEDRDWVEPVLRHAGFRGVWALDLYTALQRLLDENPLEAPSFFEVHMTARGNRWIAEQIAARLRAMTL